MRVKTMLPRQSRALEPLLSRKPHPRSLTPSVILIVIARGGAMVSHVQAAGATAAATAAAAAAVVAATPALSRHGLCLENAPDLAPDHGVGRAAPALVQGTDGRLETGATAPLAVQIAGTGARHLVGNAGNGRDQPANTGIPVHEAMSGEHVTAPGVENENEERGAAFGVAAAGRGGADRDRRTAKNDGVAEGTGAAVGLGRLAAGSPQKVMQAWLMVRKPEQRRVGWRLRQPTAGLCRKILVAR